MKNFPIFIYFIYLTTIGFSQNKVEVKETPDISSGAKYALMLEEAIKSGLADNFKVSKQYTSFKRIESTEAITTYEGINFDEDAANGGYYHIPPDPIGAVGPNHFVLVANTSIEWFTKSGTLENSQRLGMNGSSSISGSFFESLSPISGTYDPKVVYDQYNDRFVVVAVEQESASFISRILVAVSQTSDPNAGWYFHSINSAIVVGGSASWVDYPGLAVGTDAVYITANMFSFSGNGYTGGRLWIIAKSPFYSGGAATVTVHDHITLGNGYTASYQPAQMFGSPPAGVGTFLVLYSGLTDGVNEYVNVIRVDNPLTSPTFTGQDVDVGNIDNTSGFYRNAPQNGTSNRIATNDRRTQNAVWRNNTLWTTFTVIPPSGTDAGEVTSHWVGISTEILSSLSVTDQGNIGGESIATDCYTFFPSISVNSSNDVCIGFSASASTIYPGCYYTGRHSSDPAGYTINPGTLRAGLDYYYRTFSSSDNRWGDYSGVCVDPLDDETFYVCNQYAISRGTILGSYPTQDGRWGTVFGVVPVTALPVELSSFTAEVLPNEGIQLDWKTENEIDNYGFEVERLQPGISDTNWVRLTFIAGHGNSNKSRYYSYIDRNALYGKYAYRLKQIDNDGSFKYSKNVSVDAGVMPVDFILEQNYPNPFNPVTKLKFVVKKSEPVTLKIYNILGKEVETIFKGAAESGRTYEFDFNGSGLPSGIYFYTLKSESFNSTKKMLLLK